PLLSHCHRDHLYLHSFPTRRSSDLALFERQSNRISLTDQGQIFLDYTHQILELYHSLKEDLTLDEHSLPSVIHVGASSTMAHYIDRKSTRLNSSHVSISYAVFCLRK